MNIRYFPPGTSVCWRDNDSWAIGQIAGVKYSNLDDVIVCDLGNCILIKECFSGNLIFIPKDKLYYYPARHEYPEGNSQEFELRSFQLYPR